MSPCSREHAPSSQTVLLLQEHQRPATPCSVAPGCRPDATAARRFLRWFGRLGRPIMGKQGMFNVSLEARLMDTADPKINFLVWNQKVHYHVHKRRVLDLVSQYTLSFHVS